MIPFFICLHFKFTFTFTFSPLYNHKILPVTFATTPQSFYFFTFLHFSFKRLLLLNANNSGQLLHFS